MSVCIFDGCANHSRKRGLCNAHYQKLLKYGDPSKGRTNAQRGQPMQFAVEAAALSFRHECVLWPFGKFDNGYGTIYVDGSNRTVHSFVCEMAHGDKPSVNHEAAHSCGGRSCINPHHLRWATRPENHADKVAHGTDNRGEKHKMAKLTENDVRSIRSNRTPAKVLAERHGVTKEAIYMARNGRTWSWMA